MSGQYVIQLFFGDAYSVIGNQNHNILLLQPSGKDDSSLFGVLFQNAVQDTVLNDRLEGQFWDRVLEQIIRNIDQKIYGVMKTHILQLDVDRNMLQFICYGAEALLSAQRQLIKTGQLLDRRGYILGAALLGQPVDHIHCIIEKMWIDLGLQRIKFRYPQILGGLGLLIHKLVNHAGHIIIGGDQIPDLIVSVCVRQ